MSIREIIELRDASESSRGADRPAALREAATEFRPRFKAQGAIHSLRTVDLAPATVPAALAFQGAARALYPYVTVVHRLIVVQFDDFDGGLRTLVWRPVAPGGSSDGALVVERLFSRVLATERHTVDEALALVGLAPADADFVSGQHLHFPGPAPRFPDARLVVQRSDLGVPAGPTRDMDPGIEDRLAPVDGDVELGVGCALLATPGRADRHQSLCINTPGGIWVFSDNGVAADSWHPHLSKIPGVRAWAELSRREVVMNAAANEPCAEQYDSMVKEKALADVNRRDPRWLNVVPSPELAPLRRQWPIRPTFLYGGINYGRVETADGKRGP